MARRLALPVITDVGQLLSQTDIAICIRSAGVAKTETETAFDKPAVPRFQLKFIGTKSGSA